MTKRSSDAPDAQAPARRRTPTYMEAVRTTTPSSSPSAGPATADGESPGTSPAPAEREPTPIRSGVGSRTRIGLPPVTVLPGQIRRRATEGPSQDRKPGTTHDASRDRASAGSGSDLSGGALNPEPARVLSRETVLMGAAPKQDTATGNPRALVVSPVRAATTGVALERVTPASGGRKTRGSVPPADVTVSKHTVPGGRAWPLVVLGQRYMPQAAAIRSLRHRLADKGDPRVVLVTSAGRKEGKTFCAANLALALAEIRRSRVLLLEANLYHPSLASLFGLKQPTCFLEQLDRHKRDFMSPWQVTELSSHELHMMAIDSRTDRLRALEGAIFTNAMDSLRGRYDHIIIDGPPVSAGPDVSLLEDAVDGILFTARSDQARASTLKYALDQVSPQDLLGVVLMDI